MIGHVHRCKIICIHKFQNARHVSEPGKNNKLATRRPEQMVRVSLIQAFEKIRRLPGLDAVEADVDIGRVPVDDGEFAPNRLPSESMDCLLDFHAINRDLLHFHVEDFEIVKHSTVLDVVLFLLHF